MPLLLLLLSMPAQLYLYARRVTTHLNLDCIRDPDKREVNKKYFWSYGKITLGVKGYIVQNGHIFNFQFKDDIQKYRKVMSIISTQKQLEQVEKDNLLLSMQCTNENKS